MSDNVKLNRGDEYIVFYVGGPYDGQTDTRIATEDGWDDELTVIVALDGKETQLTYSTPVAKAIGDQVQVHYTWDEPDSEGIEDPEERLSEE